MLGLVARAWREWQARSRLIAPLLRAPVGFLDHEVRIPELREVLEAGGPELQPYEGLAAFYDGYGAALVPDYPAFLDHLASCRGIQLRSVLDLACGTGTLTGRLARVGEVIGVDVSERMLEVAWGRNGWVPGVSFARGDFRDFALGRQFDAVVCASNSLNYVADRGELARVFAAVSAHLRPGGLFTFDVTTEWGMQQQTGVYIHILTIDGWFAMRFSYDAAGRRESLQVILPTGVETHRRIPLGPADVAAAVKGTGLSVEDYFSRAMPWGRRITTLFFVLSKRG
jgi:SAM-dependent methyltransferase